MRILLLSLLLLALATPAFAQAPITYRTTIAETTTDKTYKAPIVYDLVIAQYTGMAVSGTERDFSTRTTATGFVQSATLFHEEVLSALASIAVALNAPGPNIDAAKPLLTVGPAPTLTVTVVVPAGYSYVAGSAVVVQAVNGTLKPPAFAAPPTFAGQVLTLPLEAFSTPKTLVGVDSQWYEVQFTIKKG